MKSIQSALASYRSTGKAGTRFTHTLQCHASRDHPNTLPTLSPTEGILASPLRSSTTSSRTTQQPVCRSSDSATSSFHSPDVQRPMPKSDISCLPLSSNSTTPLTWPRGRWTQGALNSCSSQNIVGTVPPSLILSGSVPHTSWTAPSRALKHGLSREASHHDAVWVTLICA